LLTTEPTSTIPPGRRSTVLQRLQKIVAAPTVGPALALLATMAFFSFKSDRFFQAENLSLVLQQVMVVGVLAIGQTLVILTAGIDLSVGTVMALGQIVMTKLAIVSGMPALPALLLGVLTCIGFGVLNGGLVTLVRLPSFIVTLGTLNIAFALTHVVSNNETYGSARSASLLRPELLDRQRPSHLRRCPHACALRARLVRADADRVGPPRVGSRRQSRGGTPDGHQHAASPTQRLRDHGPHGKSRGGAPRRADGGRRP
jgi:Branched-chain amino acid transport system / permease component